MTPNILAECSADVKNPSWACLPHFAIHPQSAVLLPAYAFAVIARYHELSFDRFHVLVAMQT